MASVPKIPRRKEINEFLKKIKDKSLFALQILKSEVNLGVSLSRESIYLVQRKSLI